MAPINAKETYNANIFLFTIPQTAIMAGSVVVGPEIKNASAAPLFIPKDKRPFINGKAVILLV